MVFVEVGISRKRRHIGLSVKTPSEPRWPCLIQTGPLPEFKLYHYPQLCWFGSTAADARLICGNRQNFPVNRDAADEDDSEDGEGQELAHIRLR
jgi:hypothetical protein